MELEIRMKLESPVLLASDEDRGAVLDADLVFDSNGVPYVPGRRLKGLLRERALEVVEMLNQCQLSLCDHADLVAVFGQGGAETPAPFVFNNLYLVGYQHWGPWIAWALQEFPRVVHVDRVIATFTHLRSQTSINERGVANPNSLRVFRVMNKGFTFIGTITCTKRHARSKLLLALACANLRRVGMGRTRGLGEVTCDLLENGQSLIRPALKVLKEGQFDGSSSF